MNASVSVVVGSANLPVLNDTRIWIRVLGKAAESPDQMTALADTPYEIKSNKSGISWDMMDVILTISPPPSRHF